jgi:hypothetical protein
MERIYDWREDGSSVMVSMGYAVRGYDDEWYATRERERDYVDICIVD